MTAAESHGDAPHRGRRGRTRRRRTQRVAILVKRFPRLSETFVLNEFLELRRLGLPVDLFAVQDPRERNVHAEAEALRGDVVYLRPSRWWWLRVFPRMIAWSLRRPRSVGKVLRYAAADRSIAAWRNAGEAVILASHLRRIRAGHLHAHFAHGPAAVAYLTHLVTGIPFSFTAHAKDLYTTPARQVAARARAAAFVVTCTSGNGRYLAEISDLEPLVCPHGVDLARFATIVRQPVPGRILSVGRLVPKKGFDVLLRGLARLAARGVAFECRIVGSGPIREELEAQADELGLFGRVSFAGARPQDQLLDEYARAEVFALAPVVTSDGDRDGLPNVLLEAMAAGIPAVSSSISGIPELITDDASGLLVPPGDTDALADALERLLGNEAERKRLASGAAEVVARRGLTACVRPLAERFLAQLALWPVPDAFGSRAGPVGEGLPR